MFAWEAPSFPCLQRLRVPSPILELLVCLSISSSLSSHHPTNGELQLLSLDYTIMKLIACLLWAGTALEASLVSAEAFVYTSDASPLPSKESLLSISPHTARLLFAQRLGLSQYHSLEGADETTLDILNTYGGKQQQIFAHEERTRSIDRILLIVDGVANPERWS